MAAVANTVDVRRSFDAGAATYEGAVRVQKRVAERVASLLREVPAPSRLLDVGSGTGLLLRSLRPLFPLCRFVGVDLAPGMVREAARMVAEGEDTTFLTGDAACLPFPDASFDLAVSTSTLQWVTPLARAFSEVSRVLAGEGRFVFALFGESSLAELRNSYAASGGCAGRMQELPSLSSVREALRSGGLTEVRLWQEFETELYPDVAALIRSLHRAGAATPAERSHAGLGEGRVMLRMMEAYRREYARPEGIPATYEVIYGECRKSGGGGLV